jgi:FAD/FMN-containing dehydrogenase
VLLQANDSAADVPLASLCRAALAHAAEDGVVTDATVAQTDAQAARCGRCARTSARRSGAEGPNIKHDISLPISAIPRSSPRPKARWRRAARRRLVVFGHLGDGNLHYNVAATGGASAEDFMANTPLGESHRARSRRRARRQHQRRARHRPVEARRARALQGAARARAHAKDQGGAGPDGMLNPGKVL